MSYSEHGSGHSFLIPKTQIVDEILDKELGYAKGPVRGLMAAILFDGVQTYMNYVHEIEQGRDGKKFKEAHNWVHDRESSYIFSFNNVCEGLGVEPDWLRFGLANATQSTTESVRKSRRT